MRRVVVTGLGIVSSIGNNAEEVTSSLRDARSGISFSKDFAEHGFKCQVWGAPNIDTTDLVDRRAMRFLSQGGAWNHVAMKQAIADSGLEESVVARNERTGIIMGSGGPSTRTIVDAADITRKNVSPKRIGPFAVPKAMSSTASATLATWFQIHGVNYSISSACSTSAHCIGNAAEMIQWGVSPERPFVVEGKNFTFQDFINHSKMRASTTQKQELSWAVLVVGEHFGTEHAWTNERGESITAAEAYRLGAVQEVVPREKLRDTATELARKIAGKSPKALRLAKWSLNGIEVLDPKQSYRFEQGFTLELYTSPDSQEARDAFVEKRDAKFDGKK